MQRQTPGFLFATVDLAEFKNPELLIFNEKLSEEIGLGSIEDEKDLQFLNASSVPESVKTYATAYAGHQFGNWAGQLGDGRAILAGEIINSVGKKHEIQWKGAGATPYSRHADGRAVLRSSVREYLMSEAMHHLGIPTTRALSLSLTGENVLRDVMYDGNPDYEKGAVMVRIAESFLRFGHFELISAQNDVENLRKLADFAIKNYFPEINPECPEKYAAFFENIALRTAELMVEWYRVGFVHGVMNTDNMSILGLTFDFGPYAFLDDFKQAHICNHSDHHGRYAFNQQVAMGYWNLTAFAETLTRHVAVERLQEILDGYAAIQQQAYLTAMRARLGLRGEQEGDALLVDKLLVQMDQSAVDYTLFFRHLGELPAAEALAKLRDDFINRAAFDEWSAEFMARNVDDSRSQEQRRAQMHAVNPLYMLRNYLIQIAIEAAEDGDYAPLHRLHQVLSSPFTEQEGCAEYAQRPPDWGKHLSISCSS